MIRFESVSKRFGTGPAAVEDLSLEIEQGELTTLVGPSGCGKTTSLRMINRLDDLSAGRIMVNGQDIMACDRTELRRGIGYVMQSSGLFPHRRIHENISTVPRLLGWDKKRIETRIQELVEVVGLAPDLLERFPHALSGGQQQRVGVARALAADPPVLLMDEPFAAVDPIVRTHLQDEFIRLQRQLHKTIVFVTHDIDEAIKIGDRIAVMREPGHLEQYATPSDLLLAPANDFVVDFLGRERELRRLALIRVEEIEPEPAPTVAVSGSTGDARASAERQGCGWVIVLADDGRLQGWLPLDRLNGEAVDIAAVTPFEYPVMAKDSLRAALNAIVASGIGCAARLDDDGRFEGTISHTSLNRKLAA